MVKATFTDLDMRNIHAIELYYVYQRLYQRARICKTVYVCNGPLFLLFFIYNEREKYLTLPSKHRETKSNAEMTTICDITA